MRVNKIFAILSLIVFCLNVQAEKFQTDDVLGFWLSEDKDGVVEVFKEGNEYKGKLVWIKDIYTGKVKDKLDEENPDKSKRGESLQGKIILHSFKYDDGEWNDGKIYDPKNGKTYKSYMKLKSRNELKIRGYIGFALIGRTTEWKRQSGGIPNMYNKKNEVIAPVNENN